MRSSNACGPCRLERHPSRWLIGALLVLGVLAAVSAVASGMAGGLAGLLAVLALWRAAWLARSEASRPVRTLAWAANRPPRLDGVVLHDARLQWRGPLAFLQWRDAGRRVRRLAWWPDNLPADARRELKLADAGVRGGRSSPSMAP